MVKSGLSSSLVNVLRHDKDPTGEFRKQVEKDEKNRTSIQLYSYNHLMAQTLIEKIQPNNLITKTDERFYNKLRDYCNKPKQNDVLVYVILNQKIHDVYITNEYGDDPYTTDDNILEQIINELR